MKVKAKHWVNYNGTWHITGEVFTINDADAAEMALHAEMVDSEPEHVDMQETEPSEPAKRGRKRKAEAEND